MADQSPLWEIINPSDPYTFHAESLLVAAVVCILLGHGGFSVREVSDSGEGRCVPMFFFASEGQIDEWFQQSCGVATLKAAISRAVPELPAALRSVWIGSASERRSKEHALRHIPDEAGRRAYLAELHDQQRSSLNDIGTRAWALADALEAKKGEVK